MPHTHYGSRPAPHCRRASPEPLCFRRMLQTTSPEGSARTLPAWPLRLPLWPACSSWSASLLRACSGLAICRQLRLKPWPGPSPVSPELSSSTVPERPRRPVWKQTLTFSYRCPSFSFLNPWSGITYRPHKPIMQRIPCWGDPIHKRAATTTLGYRRRAFLHENLLV